MAKQYFLRKAALAQTASEYTGFTPGARAMYAEIANKFRRMAAVWE